MEIEDGFANNVIITPPNRTSLNCNAEKTSSGNTKARTNGIELLIQYTPLVLTIFQYD